MGVWIIVGVTMMAGLGVALGMYAAKKAAKTDMAPASLDDFNVTTAQEGAVVPVIYGRRRVSGNIIWYGNLEAVAHTQTAGGKGDESEVTVGYYYYLDVWQAICASRGGMQIVEYYVQDDKRTPSATTITLNDGSEPDFPSEPGEHANRIPDVAHVFFKRLYLGENVTFVPTIHYTVDAPLEDSPVNHAVMEKGLNPAAVIYDMLLQAGAGGTWINLDKFNEAADYWYERGYGINVELREQKEIKKHIAKVLEWVGGAFGVDEEDKFIIKAFDPSEEPFAELSDDNDDFLDFTITRKHWLDTHNFFRGSYIDENQNYSTRTVSCYNPANIRLVGRQIPLSVDLTCFRDVTSASKRLWEIMKHESFPGANLTFKTNMKCARLNVGHIVRINHSRYGLEGVDYWITRKDVSEIDRNELTFQAEQVTSKLFDDGYVDSGDPEWEPPDYQPQALLHQAIFELPYNSSFGRYPAFVLLAQRRTAYENGFVVLVSINGTDYTNLGTVGTFSQRGTLDEDYPSDTPAIDDEVGILYTPARNDPVFGTISREALFSTPRIAIIGNEIIGFQSVTPEGESSYRLTGCMRGIYNTPAETHGAGSVIWLTTLADNVVGEGEYTTFGQVVPGSNFYTKMLPKVGAKVLNPADATAIHTVKAYKAAKPWPPCRVEVYRQSYFTLHIRIWPTNQSKQGAGAVAAENQTDQEPFLWDTDTSFEIWDSVYGVHYWIIVPYGAYYEYEMNGNFTLYMQPRREGQYLGEVISIDVGDEVGKSYIGPVA